MFSRDGGASYRRRDAPAWGIISSPNPTTAVIADGVTLWRTTDEGDSWHVVGKPGAPEGDSALELGFTSARQGFLIEATHGMFMTRDAGATWTRVNVPERAT